MSVIVIWLLHNMKRFHKA